MSQPIYSLGQILIAPCGGEVQVTRVIKSIDEPSEPSKFHWAYMLEVRSESITDIDGYKVLQRDSFCRNERVINESFLPIVSRYFEIAGRSVEIVSSSWRDYEGRQVPDAYDIYVNSDRVCPFGHNAFTSIDHALEVVQDRISRNLL